ncbi:sensor histidine kinase [Streptomyces sp. E11-3]|uniref:sensor histidine kinase n=1 Tax=Streptomyces sp. E11-3 TaxID=3110112 RepID=UPI00398109FB
MRTRNVWQALARPGFLLSAWPWRAAGYLLGSIPAGIAVLVALVVGAAVGGALAIVLVGLPLLALLALGGVPVGRLERWRLRLVDHDPAPDLHRVPDEPGLWVWARTRYQEQLTWRELGYAVLFALLLWPLDALAVVFALSVPLGLVATPVLMATVGGGQEASVLKEWTVTSWPMAFAVAVLGVLLFACGLYATGLLAGARAELTRLLIAPREAELDRQVTELTRSRVRLVDAFETERRRIERDLHDGAQQRLVALTMMLGMARLDAPPDSPLAGQLDAAHREVGQALEELRELIRGIHPKVLTDFGLEAAIDDVAERSQVPVDVRLDLSSDRLPDAVEAAAYFVVSEALANVAKHSGATRAEVVGALADDRLAIEISDDGRGGADASAGSGLTGLADRVSVLDGKLSLSSPPGGPTLLRVEIPLAPLAMPLETSCDRTARSV